MKLPYAIETSQILMYLSQHANIRKIFQCGRQLCLWPVDQESFELLQSDGAAPTHAAHCQRRLVNIRGVEADNGLT